MVAAVYQMLAAATAAAAAAGRALHDALRDEMYLVGRKLVNYERPPRPQMPPTPTPPQATH